MVKQKIILSNEEKLKVRRKRNNEYFKTSKGKAAQKRYYSKLYQINIKLNPADKCEEKIIDILKAQKSAKNYIKDLIIKANNFAKNND